MPDVQQIRAGNFAELGRFRQSRKQATIDVRKLIRVGPQVRSFSGTCRSVHRPKQLTQNVMGVGSIAHLLNGVGKQVLPVENPGVFGKEA